MPTKTFAADKSSLFAVTGSTELGGGQDQHLPIGGPWNGYTFTAAIRFVLDWSGVRRITSAVLQARTTGQVHVGFSGAPDVYASRATADWAANGNSESWGTSPTVYPGPPSTTSGRVSKRMPTGENATLGIDITGIVLAWAPPSVTVPNGSVGGGLPNYGVKLERVASGDISEIWSYEGPAGNRPTILLTYESDAPPPAPTITAPTSGQVVTTVRPTFTATCIDPDGDPLQGGDLEVYGAAHALVYSAAMNWGNTSLSHTPTSDLPAGALTVRMRAKANGLTGAWSTELPFTIDRPPAVGAWTAPTGNVSGTRRPNHVFGASDPDGTAISAYDIEVYQASGGQPSGSAVYSKINQTAGIAGGTITHTPTADLPGGPLLARSRVQSGGVWSAWSAYQAYTIVLTQPSIVWEALGADGGFFTYYDSELADPAVAIADVRVRNNVTIAPPSGQTITKAHCKITRVDGPTPGSIYIDADIACPAAGGTIAADIKPATGGGATGRWITPYGTATVEWSATASGGGVTTVTRTGRFAMGEWFGAIALGDQVSNLAVVETPRVDHCAVLYRAQASPTAAAGSAAWRPNSQLAALVGELPAANAYLGLRPRIARRADDAVLQPNGGFEDATDSPVAAPGWLLVGAGTSCPVHGFAQEGARLLRIQGDGATANPCARSNPVLPVLPGTVLRLRGWARRNAGTVNFGSLRLETQRADGSTISFNVITLDWATNGSDSGTYKQGYYTVPTDGSVAAVRVWAMMAGAVAPSTEQWLLDDVSLRGMGPGDAGFDRLAVTWKSLG